MPEVAPSDGSAPGAAAPGVAAPGVAAPGVAAPGVAAPGIAAPGVAAPGVAAPGSKHGLKALLGDEAQLCHRAITHEHGVSLPPFIDHHVHLHLIDSRGLAAGGIAAALDLGGDPVALARRPPGFPRVRYAGAFLTARGGYPVGREWAPAGIVREVTDPSTGAGVHGGAGTAVDEQATFGASVVKVVLNIDAGPVLEPAVLAAIVTAARTRGLPVVAHVEGSGMTQRALDAGVAAFAHTPFSEVLTPDQIARAVELDQVWISTLAIHQGDDLARSSANLEAFAGAGGRVVYGTDLGNGSRPTGIDVSELKRMDAAGFRGATLIRTLSDPWPAEDPPSGVRTFVPGPTPAVLADVPEWLGRATVVPAEELVLDEG